MFDFIREKVDLLEFIADDAQRSIIPCGTNTYRFEDDKEAGCPFCNHKDCFKMFHDEEEPQSANFKCFSCDANGSVIDWVIQRRDLQPVDACKEIAKELKLTLPVVVTSPMQQIFDAAAVYYETCLWETCNKPYVELNGKTPLEYQVQVRGHSEETLKRFKVGWSDGKLIQYLEGVGLDSDLIAQSGLKSTKFEGDFIKSKTFIYPHFVRGRASKFTFKDPLKGTQYQLRKEFVLNNSTYYNQDSIKDSDTVYVVEGENDVISLATASNAPVLGTIGSISQEQLNWLKENCLNKTLVTIFDGDGAGDKYRIKLASIGKYVKGLVQIKPEADTDIDKYLTSGGDLKTLLETNVVKEEIPTGPVQIIPTMSIEDRIALNSSLASRIAGNDVLVEPGNADKTNIPADTLDVLESGSVISKGGCYWKVTFKESEANYKKISDFNIILKNIYITESGDRHREIIVVREDGKTSRPILVDSDTKVSLKPFKVMLARAVDASFHGVENDLGHLWDLVYAQSPETQVTVTRTVGRHDGMRGWIFRNKFITDSGKVIDPDSEGVFWLDGHLIGVRPESLNVSTKSNGQDGGAGQTDIPFIEVQVTEGESDELMKGIVENLSKNINDPGKALLLLGWIQACLYSNIIFRLNGSFPLLFFWGTKGKGKTTIAKWLLDFYDMRNSGYTSVSQLKSGVGWGRKAEYYSSLPLLIDEIRSDRETEEYISQFRSYYDRSQRTMGVRDGFGVKTQDVRSCFMFVGEDQFNDPAARERCVPIRIPVNDRETVDSYRWMQDRRHLFSGITYRWILESCNKTEDSLKTEIRELDNELIEKAGCSARTSKNWASVGVFALKLAEKYLPEFDFKEYLFRESKVEATSQQTDTTLMQFFELMESMAAREMPRLVPNVHFMREANKLHLWFPAIYKEVMDDARGRLPFSKNAILQAIREEPYYLEGGNKVAMGLSGVRRTVMTLDFERCPDSLKNLISIN